MNAAADDPLSEILDVLGAAGLGAERPQVRIVDHGKSGDLVALIGGGVGAVVKLARGPHAAEALEREAAVLDWLGPRAPAAAVLWRGAWRDGYGLVMERLAGGPVSHVEAGDAEVALVALIRALSALHALDPSDCPFDARLDIKLANAAENVRAGRVDIEDFDPEVLGLSAEAAFARALRERPLGEDVVLTHGDASLPNFIWRPDQPAAMIDVARFGLADRYQDLALFLRSARYNHPQIDAAALLRAHYPLVEIDEAKCAYYRLLDEFF